ncbi:MAG: lasso peptide biosynthesis B2 protein [Burkholderiaceae bacterium]|nr:lasso peptide biosynthesis B2 protein [Burkholderiaceae bacterium]
MNDAVSQTESQLRLADHIRACAVGEQVVLLDLNRSRYFGLGSGPSKVILQAKETLGVAEDAPLVEPLIRRGLLTNAPRTQQGTSSELPHPEQTFSDTSGVGIRPLDIYRFAFAIAVAKMWLQWRSFHAISRSVQSLQRRCPVPDSDAAVNRAVTQFNRLRPLAFTSQERCLFDSLALVVFLTRQGLPVRWVVGVSTRPFRAHSWVQRRYEVLNDVHEYVRRFTPILVV